MEHHTIIHLGHECLATPKAFVDRLRLRSLVIKTPFDFIDAYGCLCRIDVAATLDLHRIPYSRTDPFQFTIDEFPPVSSEGTP